MHRFALEHNVYYKAIAGYSQQWYGAIENTKYCYYVPRDVIQNICSRSIDDVFGVVKPINHIFIS